MTVMKKLALGITGVGVACITGLGLAQPASAAIAYDNFTCESYYLQMDCAFYDDVQVVWSLDGYVHPEWDGQNEIRFGCVLGYKSTVGVTYLDSSGVSQTEQLTRYCSNNQPM